MPNRFPNLWSSFFIFLGSGFFAAPPLQANDLQCLEKFENILASLEAPNNLKALNKKSLASKFLENGSESVPNFVRQNGPRRKIKRFPASRWPKEFLYLGFCTKGRWYFNNPLFERQNSPKGMPPLEIQNYLDHGINTFKQLALLKTKQCPNLIQPKRLDCLRIVSAFSFFSPPGGQNRTNLSSSLVPGNDTPSSFSRKISPHQLNFNLLGKTNPKEKFHHHEHSVFVDFQKLAPTKKIHKISTSLPRKGCFSPL